MNQPRPSRVPRCSNCNAVMPRDRARCLSCKAWNTGQEGEKEIDDSVLGSQSKKNEVERRFVTGWDIIDEVWGDLPRKLPGVPFTSVTLIGGGPGAGKSTLFCQLVKLFATHPNRDKEAEAGTLRLPFVMATEEGLDDIADRMQRLGVPLDRYRAVDVKQSSGSLRYMILKHRPCAMFFDSLMGNEAPDPNVIVQTANRFKEYSKELLAPTFLSAHANKRDDIAGLRALQHGPDIILTLFAALAKRSEIREFASLKSRYGPSNYSRYMLMTGGGLITHEIEDDDEDE